VRFGCIGVLGFEFLSPCYYLYFHLLMVDFLMAIPVKVGLLSQIM
jgi:hypothetical protein